MADTFDPASVIWVLDQTELDYLTLAIASAEEVILDLETTGLDEHAYQGGPTNGGFPARIVLASFTIPRRGEHREPATWVLPLSHPDSPFLGQWRAVLRGVCQAMVRSGAPLGNQNVKFDCRWVYAHTGVDLSPLITWDTQVSSHLIDENASTRLKERAPATFQVARWDDFDLTYPGAAEQVPMLDLGMYAARDTYWTWKLQRLHQDQLFLGEQESEPESEEDFEMARLGRLATWCAMPMVSTLTAIEQRGMRLDLDWVHLELDRHQSEAARLAVKLIELYPEVEGDGSFAPTSKHFAAWSEAAVAHGDLRIAELTGTGRPRWSKGVLARQSRAGSQVATDLLDLRGHIKRAEYLTAYTKVVTREGRIHTTYHAGRVVTGRTSSSDPNIQQVTASLKPAFLPTPGYVFADLDYSQIELRVAAFVSRCEPMLAALRRGDDLHRILAAKITGKAPEDITPEERHGGKSANFGLLYAMSPGGFQNYADDVYGVSFTAEESIAVHQAFFETWDGMAQWHARCINTVQRTGQVTSPIGRVRRLPGIWSYNDQLSSFAERASINSPVQGLASDIMQMAAASIEGRLPGHTAVPNARIVATVHDDIVVEVPVDDWEAVTRACIHRMSAIPEVLKQLDVDFDVPLTVEGKIGSRWGWTDIGHLG